MPFYTSADSSLDLSVLTLIPRWLAVAISFLFGFMLSYHLLRFWAYFYFPEKLKNEFFVLESAYKSLKSAIRLVVIFNPESVIGTLLNITGFFVGLLITYGFFVFLSLGEVTLAEKTVMYTLPAVVNLLSYFVVGLLSSKDFMKVFSSNAVKPPKALAPESEELSILLKRAAMDKAASDPLEKLLSFDRLRSTGEYASNSRRNTVYLPMPLASADKTFSQNLGLVPNDNDDHAGGSPNEGGKKHEISFLSPGEGGRIKGRSLGGQQLPATSSQGGSSNDKDSRGTATKEKSGALLPFISILVTFTCFLTY